MLEPRDEPGIAQHPHGAQFVDGDHHRLIGLAIADEGDQTVVAGIGSMHHTGRAVDGDRRPVIGVIVREMHARQYEEGV